MKTLNLVNLENSDIKYQIQKFPDGQQNIVISPFKYYRDSSGYTFYQNSEKLAKN